jgi:sec-independent protein translocase protein TatA
MLLLYRYHLEVVNRKRTILLIGLVAPSLLSSRADCHKSVRLCISIVGRGYLKERAPIMFRPEVLFIILFIVLLFFGAKRLPEISRSIGQSIQAFRKGMNELDTPNEKEKTSPEVPHSKSEEDQ